MFSRSSTSPQRTAHHRQSNLLSHFFARMFHLLRRRPSMSPSAAELAQQRAWHNAQAQAQARAEAVTWRWMAGRATWQEAQQAQQMQLAGWPYTQAPRADGWSDTTGQDNSKAAEAIQLAEIYGVVAQEIDRRRAPSASGDHLYIAVVHGVRGAAGVAEGPNIGNYAPGSKWMVRVRRYYPEQISCACGGALPGGAGCGHIGAVLRLRRR